MKTFAKTMSVLAIAIMLLSAGPSAWAAIVAYDGFEAGGASPAAGQYETGTGFVASGSGAPGDALHNGDNNSNVGQGPVTAGFSAGSPWAVTGPMGFASTVYYQASPTTMNYTDSNGNVLVTSDGSVRHLHEATPDVKTLFRPITTTPTPGDVSYYSLMLRYESEDSAWSSTAQLNLWQGIGQSSARYTGIGITSDGKLRAYESQNANEDIGPALAQDTDHFVVVRLEELSGIPDSMHVWLNPSLDSEPSLASADAQITADYVYVGNNSSFPFNRLELTAWLNNSGATNPEDFVFFDEFRLGTTYADVTPHTAGAVIPEPSTFALAALGLLGLCCLGRRRKQRE
jgi:hypothetical protein